MKLILVRKRARPARRRRAGALVGSLRENVSAYDGVYVALAEVLDARLVTADRRLARAVAAVSSVE
jgi:predicted nucleic acid-binding protein